MKKILMRMGKNPFSFNSAEETLKKNLLGTNIGNSLFQVASHKLLTTRNAEVVPYKFTPSLKDIEWVNNNFDLFVIPLANAFRISFKKQLDAHTKFIERLNIPVMILGVGVQVDLNCEDFSSLKEIENSVKAFCNAVLKKSPSIGVRGECTKKYLLSLGYTDSQVEIIGCPSMFWYGNEIFVSKKLPRLHKNAKISFNLSPYANYAEELLIKVQDTFKNITYIPQNNDDLEKLMYGKSKLIKNSNINSLIEEIFYKKNKIVFFTDPKKWIDFLETCHFSIGTRIHGTIANIIAGTPAHIFVHDSRTKELAEYFEIPYTPIHELDKIDFNTIYKLSSFENLVKNHKKRFNKLVSFLNTHNVDNIFNEDNEDILNYYENKFQSTKFSSNIKPLKFTPKEILEERIKFLHEEVELLKQK